MHGFETTNKTNHNCSKPWRYYLDEILITQPLLLITINLVEHYSTFLMFVWLKSTVTHFVTEDLCSVALKEDQEGKG